jgi:hypothetical protein
LKKLHFLVDSSKESSIIVVESSINLSHARIKDLKMGVIMVNQVAVILARIVVSLAMIDRIVSSSRIRIHDPTTPVGITVILTVQTLTHKM